MTRSLILTAILATGFFAPLAAQTGGLGAGVRAQIDLDTLPTSKKLLQDDLVELRDTLAMVASLNSRMVRSQNAGMSSVVLASARQLQRACTAAANQTGRTRTKLGALNTPDPKGANALSSYRAELDQLEASLRSCHVDDSTAVSAHPFNAARAAVVAGAAFDAIAIHDQIRDAMVSLFGFKMPATGYIPRPRPLH